MDQHNDPAWLYQIIESAITSFNESDDRKLLLDERADDGKKYGAVGERAIVHRLAVHIERVLRASGYPSEAMPIATDCEYNRHRGAVKALFIRENLKKRVEDAERKARAHPEHEGWYFFSVFPDIIVHERGIDENNLIVVEMKRASNDADSDYDRLKLKLFTNQDYQCRYGYRLGASVLALDKGTSDERKLVVANRFIDGQDVA